MPLAPVMPTDFYKVLTPADLEAIALYLKSVKPVKNQVPAPVYRVALGSRAGTRRRRADAAAGLRRQGEARILSRTIADDGMPYADGGRETRFSELGKGGREFPGPWGKSTSRNLTSSKTAGLGNWSDADIKRAITQGVHVDGTKLKPPMGYPYYAKMTDGDLDDMIAWLRTLPPKE